MDIAHVGGIDEFFAWAEAHGIQVVATSGYADEQHWSARYTPPLTLLFGSEYPGLPEESIQRSDLRIRIPMVGTAESLNLSVAAGIVLYEARRNTLIDDSWGKTAASGCSHRPRHRDHPPRAGPPTGRLCPTASSRQAAVPAPHPPGRDVGVLPWTRTAARNPPRTCLLLGEDGEAAPPVAHGGPPLPSAVRAARTAGSARSPETVPRRRPRPTLNGPRHRAAHRRGRLPGWETVCRYVRSGVWVQMSIACRGPGSDLSRRAREGALTGPAGHGPAESPG
ncbi:TrmH family RNA methyltransferase [Nocardiopsis sp. FR6]